MMNSRSPRVALRRGVAIVGIIGCVSAAALPAVAETLDGDEYEMPLDQTILVWEDVNHEAYSGANWDVEMSTVSTLTGETAVIGYSQQPAITFDACPSPWQDLTLRVGDLSICGGGSIKSAAIHPSTRELFALQAGADSPNSLLYSVNPSTAESTLEAVLTLNDGSAPFNVRNIFFTADGQLFATWIDPADFAAAFQTLVIFSVDPSSGVMTEAHRIALDGIEGRFGSLVVAPDGTTWLLTYPTDGTRHTFFHRLDLEGETVSTAFSVDDVTLWGGSFDREGTLWAHGSSGAVGQQPATTALMTLDPDECIQDSATCIVEREDLGVTGGFVVTDVPLASVAGVDPDDRLSTGSSVELAVDGARAGSSYTIELFSDPVTLAEGSVSRLGSANPTITIPTSVPAGKHTLVVTYTVPNGLPVVERVPVTIAAGALATTGPDRSDVMFWGAVLATALGAGALLATRVARRRPSTR